MDSHTDRHSIRTHFCATTVRTFLFHDGQHLIFKGGQRVISKDSSSERIPKIITARLNEVVIGRQHLQHKFCFEGAVMLLESFEKTRCDWNVIRRIQWDERDGNA